MLVTFDVKPRKITVLHCSAPTSLPAFGSQSSVQPKLCGMKQLHALTCACTGALSSPHKTRRIGIMPCAYSSFNYRVLMKLSNKMITRFLWKVFTFLYKFSCAKCLLSLQVFIRCFFAFAKRFYKEFFKQWGRP